MYVSAGNQPKQAKKPHPLAANQTGGVCTRQAFSFSLKQTHVEDNTLIMTSIQRYKVAHGIKWQVQYRSPDGTSRTKCGFATKWEAEKWAAENTTSIASGQWRDPAGAQTTIETLSRTWWAGRQHLKSSTLNNDQRRLQNHILPTWGNRTIGSIRKSEIQAWVSGSTLSGATVRHIHSILAQILEIALDDNLIPSNPARGVKLPHKDSAIKVYLTFDQLSQLAEECGDKAIIVWILGTVGLRWGELAGLKVEDIDKVRSRLHIRRSVTYVNSEPVETLPKTHERRDVSVSLPVMRMICQQARESRPVSGCLRGKRTGAYSVPWLSTWFFPISC